MSSVPHRGVRLGARRGLPRFALGRVAIAVLYVTAIVVLWELVVDSLDIRSYMLPAPSAIADAGLAEAGSLLRHLSITLVETLIGFALATVVGIGLAALIVYVRWLSILIMPTLVAINATPKVVFAPILAIWVGFGMESKIAMAFLLSFFPVVINAARGFADVPRELVNLFRMLQANPIQSFLKVRLPNAIPAIFDGLKIAMPLALIGAIVGEFVAARQGIGQQMLLAYANFNTALVFAAVILVATLAMILFQVLVVLERIALRGRPMSDH